MTQNIQLTVEIPGDYAGKRLDYALGHCLSDYSRTCVQRWIRQGAVQVNGAVWQIRDVVQGGEVIQIQATVCEQVHWHAQALALNVVYEDQAIIVINKANNVVVHPAAGHAAGTLVNALLHHFPELAHLPRAGIVHRLDKQTTGLLVVARNLAAHGALVNQLQAHTVRREYVALVRGAVRADGSVRAPIGRHPRQRKRMAVVVGGKAAVTHYQVLQRFVHHTLLQVCLETGRTHQIRVHMTHLGYPLVGDPVYQDRAGKQSTLDFPRQALHAQALSFIHPASKRPVHFKAPLPTDMQALLDQLSSI